MTPDATLTDKGFLLAVGAVLGYALLVILVILGAVSLWSVLWYWISREKPSTKNLFNAAPETKNQKPETASAP